MKKAFKIIFYVLGFVCVIFALALGGWVSWVAALLGVLLVGVGGIIQDSEIVGETDKTILALLFYASVQDGMADQEKKYIQEYIKRRGLSKKQVNAVEKYAADPTKWKISTDESQKMRVLDEIAGLIKSDGVITESEKQFFEGIAKALEIDNAKAMAKLN